IRSHSSSIAWVICPAETESIEDANCLRFAPFSPAGAEAAREATNRSTCSCVSGGSLSTCLAISCLTSICRFPLPSGYTLAGTSAPGSPGSKSRCVGLCCQSMLHTLRIAMRCRLTAAAICAVSGVAATAQQPAGLVDPLIGTAGDGQTYPAAGVPFGMTQWTPQTRAGEVKCMAPYYAKDTRIQGFRGSHFLSGSCVQDYGSMTVMALTGELKTAADARASAFSRDTERAQPNRYQVTLADYGIGASVTGTTRAGLLRFRFPKSAQ